MAYFGFYRSMAGVAAVRREMKWVLGISIFADEPDLEWADD